MAVSCVVPPRARAAPVQRSPQHPLHASGPGCLWPVLIRSWNRHLNVGQNGLHIGTGLEDANDLHEGGVT